MSEGETKIESGIVCPSCAALNQRPADFCATCGAPLTAHAVWDPFLTIRSTGWMYRKASRDPHRLIVVIGIWLILGPALFVSLAALLGTLLEAERNRLRFGTGEMSGFLLAVIVTGGAVWAYGTLVGRTTLGYWQHRRKQALNNDDEDEEETDDKAADDPDAAGHE